VETSESIKHIALALSKAQSEMKGVHRSGNNPFYNSAYSTLGDVQEAVREPFSKNELSYTQTGTVIGQDFFIATTLMHSSGEWIRGYYPVLPLKKEMQAYGSATTYSRRYGLQGIAGIASEDDDGNLAVEKPKFKNLPDNLEQKVQSEGDKIWDQVALGNMIFTGGKFEGKPFKEVILTPEGKNYCKWAEKEMNDKGNMKVSKTLREFVKYGRNFNGPVDANQ
jgi:hypothetical protein